MWSVSTIITGLISFMVETSPTLGSIETSTFKKKQLAKESLHYNVKDVTFQKLFPDLVQLHNDIVEKKKRLMGCNSNNDNNNECNNNNNGNGCDNSIKHGKDSISKKNSIALYAGLVALLSIICAMKFLL